MIKNFKPRLYQQTIFGAAAKKNTLVVLPTGIGKTNIFLMLAAHRLKLYPNSKILLIGPTRPLIEQYLDVFKKHFEIEEKDMGVFTGFVRPNKRAELWKKAKIVFSTPQGLENDIITNRINLGEVCLLGVDECLTEDAEVLLANNETKKIKDVVESFLKGNEIYVKSFDIGENKYKIKRVRNARKIPCTKKVINIKTENNENIKATIDHPFLVKSGGKIRWIKAGEISLNDMLAFYPEKIQDGGTKDSIIVNEKDILDTYPKKAKENVKIYFKSIALHRKYKYGSRRISKKLNIPEHLLRNWLYENIKPVPLKTIAAMKEIGLLPFSYKNPKAKVVARLIGHVYGDGWFSSKKNKPVIGFSGRQEDLKTIQDDLKSLKIKYSKIHSRKTTSLIKNIPVKGRTNSFNCSDRRLVRLLFALNTPHGKKVNQKIEVPTWILNGSKQIKREFLASLFGSDADCPLQKKSSRSFYSIRFYQNKLEGLKGNCVDYMNQIQKMLKEFDVKVNKTKITPGNIWKDGNTKTVKLSLTIANTKENMVSFLREISFKYCLSKEKKAVQILNYLILNNKENKLKKNKFRLISKLKSEGYDNHVISKILDIPKYKVERIVYGDIKGNIITSMSFPTFDIWSKKEFHNILWKDIASIDTIKNIDYVYDLTIEDTHNFIANRFIVHNCHRAVGDYAYVFVASQYVKKAKFPRIIGMTASPGSDMEKIKEVCSNLFIEDIEVRSINDEDVKPYVKEIDLKWVKVELPAVFKKIKKEIEGIIKDRMQKLKKWGILRRTDLAYVNKKDILMLQAQLRGRAASGEKDFVLWNGISVLAEIMKVYHGLELLETQGIIALHKYLEKIREEGYKTKTKAVKNLLNDTAFKSVLIMVGKLYEDKVEHPKLIELQKLIEKEIEANKDAKIIVFNQYRDNALDIKEKLNQIEGVNAELFVGQLKKGETGLSQKQQKEILDKFKEREFNIIVATSVGEEGLDIPKVDLVIFFEPIPSAIRHIQRRGRTGRQEKGRVIILMAEGTRDVGYKWAAHHKEKRMYRNLDNIKKKISLKMKDVTLDKFSENKIKVYADYREKSSGVIKELVDLGIEITMEKLENADYILSSRVGVELKTIPDFVDSIIDGRLLQQVKSIKENFEKPVVLIEGIEDIYSMRNIHPNSIRGMLATIAVDFGVPFIYSRNPKETASILSIIAKREQDAGFRDVSMHSGKPLSLKEKQEYIVSSFPGVGPALAKPLLKKFKTIKKIVNAKQEKLQKVEKIGPKKAADIKEVIEKEWEE